MTHTRLATQRQACVQRPIRPPRAIGLPPCEQITRGHRQPGALGLQPDHQRLQLLTRQCSGVDGQQAVDDPVQFVRASLWVLLTRNPKSSVWRRLTDEGISALGESERGRPWTDRYSNLLPLLK